MSPHKLFYASLQHTLQVYFHITVAALSVLIQRSDISLLFVEIKPWRCLTMLTVHIW